MAQPWRNQGAMPLPDQTSPKQDGRHRSNRRNGEQMSSSSGDPRAIPRMASDIPASVVEGSYRRTESGSTDDELKDSGISLPVRYSQATRPNSSFIASLSSPVSYASQVRVPQIPQTSASAALHSRVLPSVAGRNHSYQSESGAATTYTRTDRASGVKSTVETGSAAKITAPELSKQGISVHKSLLESRGSRTAIRNDDKSTPIYKIQSNKKDSFKIGNVIQLLWTEPMNEATNLTHFDNDIGSTRVRRFVIIREGTTCCAALPISTYGGRGAGAPGIVRSHHAIIFTTREVPKLLPGEEPTYVGSTLDSLRHEIRVIPNDRSHRLDPASRLNFAKIYQITYATCEIYVFGRVAPESRHHLLYQFIDVQQQLSRPFHNAGNDESSVQRRERRQTSVHAGLGHARVDSVQQYPRNPPKSDESSEASNDESSDDSDEDDEESTSQQEALGTSTETLAQQLASLDLRAGQFGADLRGLTDQQRQLLAQLPTEGQNRAVLNLLQRQNPQRHEQVLNVLRSRQASVAGGQADHESEEDDSD